MKSKGWLQICIGMLFAIYVAMCTWQSRPHAMKQGNDSVGNLAETIFRYVASRPNACDTVDGVCEWWIPQQRYVETKGDVLAALELLRAHGQIDTRTGADGRVLYCARRTSVPLWSG